MTQNFDPQTLIDQARRVRRGARVLARQSTAARNEALRAMAAALRAQTEAILEANRLDLRQAEAADRDEAYLDRLLLTKERIEEMASALDEVVALDDPIGGDDEMWRRPNGLQVEIGRAHV